MWKNRLFVTTTQTFAVGNCKYFLFCYLAYCFFCYCCVCSSLENTTPRNFNATFILPHAYLLPFYDAECCFCITVLPYQSVYGLALPCLPALSILHQGLFIFLLATHWAALLSLGLREDFFFPLVSSPHS